MLSIKIAHAICGSKAHVHVLSLTIDIRHTEWDRKLAPLASLHTSRLRLPGLCG